MHYHFSKREYGRFVSNYCYEIAQARWEKSPVIGDWLKVSESWAVTGGGYKASLASIQEEGRCKREFPLIYREFWIILCVNNKGL